MTKPLAFDVTNIPAELTAKSYIGDILVAYGFCSYEQVEEALTIQAADKVAGRTARLTGQILVSLGHVSQEEVDLAMKAQNHLRGIV